MVVPNSQLFVNYLSYGYSITNQQWCIAKYDNLMPDLCAEFHEKECCYCGKQILSIELDHDLSRSTQTPWTAEVKFSCWCAMWLWKAKEKQYEWDIIQPVFDEWIKEKEVPWVTSTN